MEMAIFLNRRALAPRLGDDIDHNPSRKQGNSRDIVPRARCGLGFRRFSNQGYLQVVVLVRYCSAHVEVCSGLEDR
jgi:hypothetical protein